MSKQSDNFKINIEQIETERKNIFNLVMIVFFLGLLLNCIASAVFRYLEVINNEWILLWIPLIVSIFVLVLLLFSLLRPVNKQTVIPIVIFYNLKSNTISVPKELHYPSKFRIPFPILCHLLFNKYKSTANNEKIDQLIFDEHAKLLENLIQFLSLKIYIDDRFLSWTPFHRASIGPFKIGQQENKPSEEYKIDYLSSFSNNDFFRASQLRDPLMLPPKTKIDFPAPGHFRLHSSLFELEFRVVPVSSEPLEMWNLARGFISSWDRDLSSDYKDTYAFLYYLYIDFSLKNVFWRFLEEDWLPERFRPKVSIQELYDWVNSWVSLARDFFDWVDEDLRQFPKNELVKLVDETQLAYESKAGGIPGIVFKS